MEFVVLVDEHDNETGIMEKMQAHREGKLHRAISVFLFNSQNELLLQQRAEGKYHSAGLWTNACCSHPRPGETVREAAGRRLREEMGISADLQEAFCFVYKAQFANGLTEYEFDHVFSGVTNDMPMVDPGEVAAYKYISPPELLADVAKEPQRYTEWFKICLRDHATKIFQ